MDITKNKNSRISRTIILFLVGLFPIIFAVIYVYAFNDKNNETLAITITTFIGGLLSSYVARKEYDINNHVITKKNNINLLLLLIVLVVAVFYNISCLCFFHSKELNSFYGENDKITVSEWIATLLFAPIGEEMIYRNSILLSLYSVNGSKKNPVLAIVISSLLFMIVHLSGSLLRNIDIFLFSCFVSILFLITNNLIYSIVFHSASNLISFTTALICQSHKFDIRIVLISLPLLLIEMFVLYRYIIKQKSVNSHGETL